MARYREKFRLFPVALMLTICTMLFLAGCGAPAEVDTESSEVMLSTSVTIPVEEEVVTLDTIRTASYVDIDADSQDTIRSAMLPTTGSCREWGRTSLIPTPR